MPAGAAGERRRQLRRRPDRHGRVIGVDARTLTLAAQIDDMRVSATWLHQGTSEAAPDVAPDTQALDTLFTDAVLKVRRDPRLVSLSPVANSSPDARGRRPFLA